MLAAGTMQALPDSPRRPVGEMLAGTGRHPWRSARIRMIVRLPGHRSVTTHLFDSDSDFVLVPGDAGEPVALGPHRVVPPPARSMI